ncbi:MAG: acetoacetyl-CoA reductase [Magnetococcales bacterium]|nr:acetoacetyl-CoA reductase [Magnetococcales bacterium]MBF0151054.1 acetoacetyl-CoA reductase [Magnetococcales bacterium]MBF0173129.1 acetoacetyl-CoA reductase [Magnetococcales bacterium]MBF0346222.1 acetoacetyl-CoA reductase [Magnetococcales bacterium]MBF0632331.1 acetoacetyl-CoA reductase [Magnetococcales bacterium]
MIQKHVLVTGGLGGIGTAIVKYFARAGYKTAATYASFEKDKIKSWMEMIEREVLEVHLFEVDVADFESCHALSHKVAAEFGSVDILVNCAGIIRDSVFKKMPYENWDQVLKVNLYSVFNVTRHFFEAMLIRKWGRVINITSVNGQKGQFGQANYSATKAGVHGLTMALAQEGAKHGVTVNSVAPGYTATEMMLQVPESVLDDIKKHIPMGRLAKPEEIAASVLFLASEDAAFITGVNLDVNGGQWMHH